MLRRNFLISVFSGLFAPCGFNSITQGSIQSRPKNITLIKYVTNKSLSISVPDNSYVSFSLKPNHPRVSKTGRKLCWNEQELIDNVKNGYMSKHNKYPDIIYVIEMPEAIGCYSGSQTDLTCGFGQPQLEHRDIISINVSTIV